ncbi:MAG: DUF4180 domain-containing protein [Bacteroidetes bacterium]|nr:DUF4180 domain-containing protein [Bacteroidota bacterium]
MNINVHHVHGKRIAEVISDKPVLTNAAEGLELLMNLYYQDFDRIILHEKDISPDFFYLKTGLAGEVLQKFSNYRVSLAIVGHFENMPGDSLHDFIRESNRSGHIHFVASTAEAIGRLS